MEKMNKEVKEAVKELLEKIPEEKLSEAVGGLKPSTRNVLLATFGVVGGLGVLSGVGYGGYKLGQKSLGKNNKQETPAGSPAKDPAPTGAQAAIESAKETAAAAGADSDKEVKKEDGEGETGETKKDDKNPGGGQKPAGESK